MNGTVSARNMKILCHSLFRFYVLGYFRFLKDFNFFFSNINKQPAIKNFYLEPRKNSGIISDFKRCMEEESKIRFSKHYFREAPLNIYRLHLSAIIELSP